MLYERAYHLTEEKSLQFQGDTRIAATWQQPASARPHGSEAGEPIRMKSDEVSLRQAAARRRNDR
jgi:hypothetical protein